MTDHNQDRSKDEGQQGIDRETEKRNRENETGQQDGGQQSGQQQTGGQSGSASSDQRRPIEHYLTKGDAKQDSLRRPGRPDTDAGTADSRPASAIRPDSELDDVRTAVAKRQRLMHNGAGSFTGARRYLFQAAAPTFASNDFSRSIHWLKLGLARIRSI